MDNAVVIEEIGWITSAYLYTMKRHHLQYVSIFSFIEELCHTTTPDAETSMWSPLLLVVPLRLGLLNINPIYIDSLKVLW